MSRLAEEQLRDSEISALVDASRDYHKTSAAKVASRVHVSQELEQAKEARRSASVRQRAELRDRAYKAHLEREERIRAQVAEARAARDLNRQEMMRKRLILEDQL